VKTEPENGIVNTMERNYNRDGTQTVE